MSELLKELFDRGHEFNVFQALVLMEEYYKNSDTDGYGLWEKTIRFSADPQTAFPGSDIALVYGDNNRINILVTFLGLMGISSPLPNYFIEYGAMHGDEQCALMDLIRIFENRFYYLFFQVWKKYYPFSIPENDINRFINTLSSIYTGAESGEPVLEVNELSLCFSMLSGASANINSLIDMVSDCCEGVKVDIEQWNPQWVNVDNSTMLGIDLILSANAILGERVLDRSGKFTVVLELNTSHSIKSFIGSTAISGIYRILEVYLPQFPDYDVKIKFSSANMDSVILGTDNTVLGIDSICGIIQGDHTEYFLIFPGNQSYLLNENKLSDRINRADEI